MKTTLILGGALVLLLTLGCAGAPVVDTPTMTVEEAVAAGYSAELEPCANRTEYPEIYEAGVVWEEQADGLCIFYYPPSP